MATDPKEHTEEELLQQAAQEIRQLNPHIGDVLLQRSEEEQEQILRDAQELERIWLEIERNGRAMTYTAEQAVNEDRGE